MKLRIHGEGRWLAGVAATILTVGLAAGAVRGDDGSPGAVYCLTNAAAGNQLAVFQRDAHGRLTLAGTVATGGLGTGAGLGSQGALVFGSKGRTLYAVNAGSDSITVFRLGAEGPEAIQVIDSGGRNPISLAARHDVLYVLNAGGDVGAVDQITGFQTGGGGQLQPRQGSTQPLSAANTNPAQVGFSQDERALVVTEKGTNLIDTYLVNRTGYASGPNSQPSSGMEPFGFAFNKKGFLIVSEAFGGAADASAVSSYGINSDTGLLTAISPSVPTNQTAACWIAITKTGTYAFSSNTGSGTITGYSIAPKTGALSLLNPNGITGVTGGAPADLATVGDGFLYVLTATSSDKQVVGFQIQKDGSLVSLGATGGLPTSAVGLAAK
jgi:6-phosphogluconolactonase (cycloisomerase 2 family)